MGRSFLGRWCVLQSAESGALSATKCVAGSNGVGGQNGRGSGSGSPKLGGDRRVTCDAVNVRLDLSNGGRNVRLDLSNGLFALRRSDRPERQVRAARVLGDGKRSPADGA